jgi:hypothetical protein
MPALVGLDDNLVCDALTFVCRDVRWMSYMIAFLGERNSPGLYSAAVFLQAKSSLLLAKYFLVKYILDEYFLGKYFLGKSSYCKNHVSS